MSNAIAVFRTDGLSIVPTPDATLLLSQALERAALVSVVDDEPSNAQACAAMSSLKLVLSATEKARKDAKQPFLDACRHVDSVAAQFVSEADSEFKRLQRASADWQTEQTRKLQEIERKRREEAERLERERLEEIRRIERERIAKEREAAVAAAAAASAAKSAEDKLAAEALAESERVRITHEAEQAKRVAEERAAQSALTLTPEPVRAKAEGQVVREVWEFEVVNPFDLVRAHPACVQLTVRKDEVNQLIQSKLRLGENPPRIPGLRVFTSTKVQVRAQRAGKVVDV